MLYEAIWAASRSITLKTFSWIFLKLIFPCLSLSPKKDPGLCSQPLGVLSLFFWKILLLRRAGWKGSGQSPSSVPGCAPLWEGSGWFRGVQTWSCCSQQSLVTPQCGCRWAAVLCSALRAGTAGVSFSVFSAKSGENVLAFCCCCFGVMPTPLKLAQHRVSLFCKCFDVDFQLHYLR